jgi:hypothetical protein
MTEVVFRLFFGCEWTRQLMQVVLIVACCVGEEDAVIIVLLSKVGQVR